MLLKKIGHGVFGYETISPLLFFCKGVRYGQSFGKGRGFPSERVWIKGMATVLFHSILDGYRSLSVDAIRAVILIAVR